jgi:hypothetical protein
VHELERSFILQHIEVYQSNYEAFSKGIHDFASNLKEREGRHSSSRWLGTRACNGEMHRRAFALGEEWSASVGGGRMIEAYLKHNRFSRCHVMDGYLFMVELASLNLICAFAFRRWRRESTKRTVSEICQGHFRHFLTLFRPRQPSSDPPKRKDPLRPGAVLLSGLCCMLA